MMSVKNIGKGLVQKHFVLKWYQKINSLAELKYFSCTKDSIPIFAALKHGMKQQLTLGIPLSK